MKIEQCEQAVALADALFNIEKILGIVKGAGDWRLQLCAVDDGGSMKNDTMLPSDMADEILQPIMAKIRDEMKALGVVPD